MANEKITENIVRKHFENNKKIDTDKIITIEEQISVNPRIIKLLRNASKSGSGAGYPEFIISYPSPYNDLLIVIECKADINKHESKDRKKFKDYAVDGVLLYSSYLSREYDVLSIAVSGTNKKNILVSNFLQFKGENKIQEIPANIMLTATDYLNQYLHNPKKEKQNYESILKYSSDLNENLRSLDLSESHRPLLVSGILIALEDPTFRSSFHNEERPSDLSKLLMNTIEKVLDKQNIQGFKKDNMKQSYSFIGTHSKLASPKKEKNGEYNTLLIDLIRKIEDKVFSFTKTYRYYDVLGKFYSEFLRYANGDKSLGIVLTPFHITELFIKLANLNHDSIVLDNCTGTGGFLISAMKKMISLCNGETSKENHIYNKQLIGIESQSNMFSLVCSNMMIRGDGKSNIYYGSCFDLIDEIKKHKPNVGFLNPPYSKRGDNVSEWDYILNNLECLEQNSLCIAIIPISCVIDDPLKGEVLENHTLEAVLSMPEDLFHDSKAGTCTCIVVLRAHKKHPENKKTWFSYCRDDGFIKVRNKGRVDINETWPSIENRWIEAFQNNEIIDNFSIMKKVTANEEWCAEKYLTTNYKKLDQKIFVDTCLDYLSFLSFCSDFKKIQDFLPEIDKKKYKHIELDIKNWKLFRLSSIFNICRGIPRTIENNNIDRGIPIISASTSNNGFSSFSKDPPQYSGNCITIANTGQASVGVAFYQPYSFISTNNINILKPIFEMNHSSALFIVTILKLERYRFSYGRVLNQERNESLEIMLPNKDGIPDFNFMQDYILSLSFNDCRVIE